MKTIAAVILAGGKSSRMGKPKELLPWRGGTMISELVKEVVALQMPCLIVSNQPERLRELEWPGAVSVTSDLVASAGPVSGLVTAFRARSEDVLLVLSCDLPFLGRTHLNTLLAYADTVSDWDVVAVRQGERLHPLLALYHRRSQQVWEDALRKGELRLMDGLASLRVVETPPDLLDEWAVFNANTPAEYEQALCEEKRRKTGER